MTAVLNRCLLKTIQADHPTQKWLDSSWCKLSKRELTGHHGPAAEEKGTTPSQKGLGRRAARTDKSLPAQQEPPDTTRILCDEDVLWRLASGCRRWYVLWLLHRMHNTGEFSEPIVEETHSFSPLNVWKTDQNKTFSQQVLAASSLECSLEYMKRDAKQEFSTDDWRESTFWVFWVQDKQEASLQEEYPTWTFQNLNSSQDVLEGGQIQRKDMVPWKAMFVLTTDA